MFNWFKKDEAQALKAKIAATTRRMENAMKKHGVNSWQVREFDKQIDQLESELEAF